MKIRNQFKLSGSIGWSMTLIAGCLFAAIIIFETRSILPHQVVDFAVLAVLALAGGGGLVGILEDKSRKRPFNARQLTASIVIILFALLAPVYS